MIPFEKGPHQCAVAARKSQRYRDRMATCVAGVDKRGPGGLRVGGSRAQTDTTEDKWRRFP